DEPVPVPHGVREGPVRSGDRDGCDPRCDHAALRRPDHRRVPSDRRQGRRWTRMSVDTRATVTIDRRSKRQAPQPTRTVKSTKGDKVVGGVSHVVMALWSLVVILPMVWTLIGSFKTTKEIFASPFGLPENWSFDNYVSAWVDNAFGQMFLNTVIVVGVSLALVMILGAMCAYVLARFSLPGSRVIYYLMLAGLTFPVFLAIVPLFFILQNMGLLNTLQGLIVTYVAFALPFTVFFLFSFFKSL